jgi:hypothetical protein
MNRAERRRETKTLANMSILELKGAVYDMVASIQRIQNDVQAINQEIARRQGTKTETPKDK